MGMMIGGPLIIEAVRLDDCEFEPRMLIPVEQAANWDRPAVFCPPLCTFRTHGNAKTDNILEGIVLSVECDRTPAEARGKLEALLGPATVVVESGGEWTNPETGEIEPKVHLHWRLKKPAAEAEELALLYEARSLAATLVGADRSNISIVHPIRWPGSWHRKRAPKLARIVALAEDVEIELAEAVARLREAVGATVPDRSCATGKGPRHGQVAIGRSNDDIMALIARSRELDRYGQKQWHNSMLSAVASAVNKGWTDEQIYDATADYCDRSWGDRDIEVMIRGAREKWQVPEPSLGLPERLGERVRKLFGGDHEGSSTPNATDQEGLFRVFRHGEPYADQLVSWLITDLVPENGAGLASGQWGTAKTFAMLDLAGSVMTGTPFAGREVARKGGVLFVAAEGANQIRIRLEALVEGKLRPAGEASGRLPYSWIEDCPDLQNDDAFIKLVATAKSEAARMAEQFDLPLVLIIIDTLSAAGNFKDGNDAAEGQRVMNRLVELSRQTGAFVLAVDHFGKAAEAGTRGSTAKEAAADAVLAFLGDRELNGTVSKLRMAVRKIRGGQVGTETPFALRVVEMGNGSSTCVVEWQASAELPPPPERRWPKGLRILKSALTLMLVGGGKPLRPFGNDGVEVRAAALDVVRAEFMATYPSHAEGAKAQAAAKRQAFGRALNEALEGRLIGSREIDGIDHLWLVADDANANLEPRG
jgi:hypothetical protein